MPGPAPKPANMRQNRSKKSTRAILSTVERTDKAPQLPNPDNREFHELTLSWWSNVWSSPMASEYLVTDIDGLGRVALLVDEYYKAPVGKSAKELMAEIRLQEARFGLSPVDRSRLQWEVAKGEEAQRKRQPSTIQKSSKDPRGILGVVG
jgi:hypothetical protein